MRVDSKQSGICGEKVNFGNYVAWYVEIPGICIKHEEVKPPSLFLGIANQARR